MGMQSVSEYPSGGALGIDESVAAAFMAHIRSVCAADRSDEENRAAAEVDRLLREMSSRQREYVHIIANAMKRLADSADRGEFVENSRPPKKAKRRKASTKAGRRPRLKARD